MTKVSIIIPVWNLWHMTLQCLESLAATCAQDISEQRIEVIIVDNGSEDETKTALTPTLARLFGECGKTLTMPTNLGFAKACNAGARAASHPLLFFLNNDTILTSNWLPPLVHAIEDNPKLGAVGPLLLYPDNTVQHCGICFDPSFILDHLYTAFPSSHPIVNKQRLFQAITAAAMLIPAKLFAECGSFFEGYVNGFEDIDLCCALREKGLYTSCIPKSRIYHLESQTPGRFKCDDANSRLLRDRRASILKPDLHSIALKDGFTPVLSPTLTLYLTLPEAKEKALTMAFSQNFDLQRCQAKLEAEPLWFGGYELMAKHFEALGMLTEALGTWLKLTNICPLPQYYEPIKRLAKLTGEEKILEQAEGILLNMQNTMSDTHELEQKAIRIKKFTIENEDQALASIVDVWSRENIVK